MPRGDNPNSRANLKKSHGGKGTFTSETARKAASEASALRTGVKKAKDAVKQQRKNAKEDLKQKDPFTPELLLKIKTDLASAAAEGDREAQKMILKIFGEDISDAAKKKAKADLKKTEAETKKIIAETKLIELKMASPEEAEDEGFFHTIEVMLADVWGGDPE